MVINFTSRTKPKQNIKLECLINNDKPTDLKVYDKYKYNGNLLFFYNLSLNKSKILLTIHPISSKKNGLKHFFIGYFLYDIAIKYNVSDVALISKSNEFINDIVFEFRRKDYIFNKYLNNSSSSKFKDNLNLDKKKRKITI